MGGKALHQVFMYPTTPPYFVVIVLPKPCNENKIGDVGLVADLSYGTVTVHEGQPITNLLKHVLIWIN